MNTECMNLTVQCPANVISLEYLDVLCAQTLHFIGHEKEPYICFIIHELLINAIEATNSQYGKISSNYLITLYIQITENLLEVSVKDCGHGIPQNVLAAVKSQTFTDIVWQEKGRGLMLVDSIADEWRSYQDKYGQHVFTFRIRRGIE